MGITWNDELEFRVGMSVRLAVARFFLGAVWDFLCCTLLGMRNLHEQFFSIVKVVEVLPGFEGLIGLLGCM